MLTRSEADLHSARRPWNTYDSSDADLHGHTYGPGPGRLATAKGTKPDGSSYASLSSRGFDSLFVDDAHQSRLKPVVEQESAMAQLVQSQGTGFRSIARNDELVPSTFKRRLTSSKRSQGTSQSRTQQLLIEPVQSDSPKGLDRALTPAMVEALQIRETIDTGPCIVEQGKHRHQFETSFTRRYSARRSNSSSDEIAGVSDCKQHGGQLAKPPDFQAGATATISLAPESSIKALKPSPRGSTEEQQNNHGHKIGAGRNILIQGDHVLDFVKSKWIRSITTRRPQSDSGSGSSTGNSTIPAQLLKPKLQELVRTNINRISQRSMLGISKPTIFEMYTMKGRLKLSAKRESGRNTGFEISDLENSSKGKLVVASLIASTFAENQFLLVGMTPSSPGAAFDPEHDPVIMAVAFEKCPLTGQRLATVLLPEEKKLMAGCPDLGSKKDIKALFQAHRNGKQLPNIKTLTSLQSKEMRNARSTKASIKNIQLQESAEPEEYTPDAKSSKAKRRRMCFEFGRLRHNNEFVCDFVKPILNPVQAMGLAIACSAPKRAFSLL